MPDSHVSSAALRPAGNAPVEHRARRGPIRWASPLLRRILLVNLVPLALLLAALLYLDQYQNGLLTAEVGTLREQARIFAGALGDAAVSVDNGENPRLLPDLARRLLRGLTEPTPNAQARLYAPDGQLLADSRARDTGTTQDAPPLPPLEAHGRVVGAIGRIYDRVLGWLPRAPAAPVLDTGPSAAGLDWQPDVRQEVRLAGADQSREMSPYIRRTQDNRLLVTVAEPVQSDKHTVGIVLLTREAREVDASLLAVRLSILALFGLALGLTVLLSWYLSQTIARPILRLAAAAERLQEGHGRTGAVPGSLLRRSDEVGELAAALDGSARALWARMDAIERFAADVAHEIKNPLTSIRSAIETMRRVDDAGKQRRLLGVIAEDVGRLDRLISDISDASRVDAELSRTAAGPVDVVPILSTLAEIHETTRSDSSPRVDLVPIDGPLIVQAVEGRLVQVLRNLIANAESFSPFGGRIWLRATGGPGVAEISVEDQGPGIPEAKLEHIFDRFYSERPEGERFGQHSGLGLSISRQIAEALRGSLTAENRRDETGRVCGARLILRLPRANA